MVDPVEMLIARIMDGQPVRHASVKIIRELQARAETAEAALDGSPVVTKFFVDLLKQKCDAEKARADAAEKRVEAAEYEAKRYCQDVARWHERAEIMEKALTKIASCERRMGGDVVDIARKALLEAKP